MKVCIVYDCLYPWTIGGAERWYRNLGERLAAAGHDVTYITLRQWPRSEPPRIRGVRVIAVGPRLRLYRGQGRRRLAPPLLFGAGVLWHLLRHGSRYRVVHTASFPYFSVLAAALARRVHGFGLVVDWLEFWPRRYWDDYLGRIGGAIGWRVQWLCARVPQRAFTFTTRQARRVPLASGPVTVLRGMYAGPHAGDPVVREPRPAASPPVVVFAGRLTVEKRVPTLVPAVAAARALIPGLVLEVFGDGPDHRRVVEAAGGAAWVRVRGFVEAGAVDEALSRAACMVLPSVREGYGLVVVEALAHGCPVVVVDHPDNGAVELVEDGVNGAIAASGAPADLAAAIVRAVQGGDPLRCAAARWYAEHASELALDTSLDAVAAAYAAAPDHAGR